MLAALALPAPADASQAPGVISLPHADRTTDEEFNRIASVRELADGSVLMVDRGDDRLYHVRWERAPVQVGRKGSGPGEFHTVGDLFALGGDSTLLTDQYTGRWNLLVGATVAETESEGRPLNQLFGGSIHGADVRGRVLDVVGVRSGPGLRGTSFVSDTNLMVVAARASQRADTIARLKGVGSRGLRVTQPSGSRPGRIVANNPFESKELALLMVDGWIAVARADPYRIDWRSPDGDWTKGSALEPSRVRVTEREKCAIVRRLGWDPPGAPCRPDDYPGWPEFAPPFLATPVAPPLFADPRGRLLVRRTPTADHPGNRYDLIDRAGRRIGVIELPATRSIVGFGASHVYVAFTGEDGTQSLHRHAWRP